MERLVFVEGAQKGQRFPVDRGMITLGRDRQNDVPIDDPGASRQHCTIFRTEEGLRLRDEGSTNGTLLNSRTVRESALAPGDRIAIGDTVILIEGGKKKKEPSVLVSDAAHDMSSDITFPVNNTTLFNVPAAGEACATEAETSKALFRFSTTLGRVHETEDLLPLAIRSMGEILGADRAAVLLLDEDEALEPRAAWPEAPGNILISRTISEYVLANRSAVLSNPGSNDQLRKGVSISTRDVGSILCVPVLVEDRLLGVVYLDKRLSSPPFAEQHMRLVSALAMELAFALESAELYRSLRNAEEFASCILKSISAGLLVIDERGVVIRANESAEEILDLDQKDFVGLPLTTEGPLAGLAEVVQQTRASGLPSDRVELEVLVGERNVPLGVSTSLLEDYAGQAIGVVCTFRDMSRVRKLESEVKRTQRMAALGEMAAGIAHEVRNPLNSVRGFAQLLGEAASERNNATDQEYAQIIVEEVDRINRIVQDLLDFSRQQDLTMQLLSLPELLHSTASALRPHFAEAGVRIRVEVPETPYPHVMGSRDKLKQLFVNLLRNALQACETGGTVTLAMSKGQDESGIFPIGLVTVRDDGCGITAEDLEKIFDPFFTTKDSGTGLGLSICQKIVEQHSGRLEVDTTPGMGSVFSVILPAREE